MRATTTVEKQSHKSAAVSFLRMVSSGNVKEAFDTYAGSDFRHHNPYFPADPASIAQGMKDNADQYPNKTFEVQRALEDGDLVAVHSRLRMTSRDPEIAVVHVFRFVNDRIIEFWDIAQEVPKDSPNQNGMF